MERFLICCAALVWIVSGPGHVSAQSSQPESYQSILASVDVPNFDQIGTYSPGGYQHGNQQGPMSPPMSNASHRQEDVAGQLTAPPAPASQGGGHMGVDPYPVQSGAAPSAAAPAAHGGCGGGCNSVLEGNSFGSQIFNGAPSVTGFDANPYSTGCDSGAYGAGGPVYSPGSSFACDAPAAAPVASAGFARGIRARGGRNLFFGLNGLIFDRDFEDDVYLARNPAGQQLLSTDADTGPLGGFETFFGSRNCCGNGWELRYWGLFADDATYSLAGASFDPYISGLRDLTWPTTGDTVYDVYARGTNQTVTRRNEFHNIEANALRRGGCYSTRFGQCASYELLGGFRWFEFSEDFRWDVTGPAAPNLLAFDTEVANTLLGFQLGGRSDICLTRRMRVNLGTRFGIFNNRARVNQSISNTAGTYATFDGGTDYNFSDSKNDLALLGEGNLGTTFCLNQCNRIALGYRVIGINGVALAPNQFSNFNYEPAIRDVQTNGSLILGGAYFGFEMCR